MKKCILLAMLLSTFFLMANVKVIEQNDESIFVQITIENYEINNFNEYADVRIPNWEYNNEPGSPFLPQKIMNIAVPPNAEIAINITDIETETMILSKPIAPAASIVDGDETEEYIYQINQQKYADFPSEFLTEMDRSWYRHFEFFPVQYNPFLFDLKTNELKICKKISFELKISGDTSYRHSIADDFANVYEELFVNYQTARNWRSQKENHHVKMPFEASEFWYKIESDQTGMHKIGYDQLSKLPDFCDPNTLRLFTMQRTSNKADHEYDLREITLHVIDDNNLIDSNDEIYFEKKDENIFWLSFGVEIEAVNKLESDFSNLENAFPVLVMERKEQSEENVREEIDGIIIYPEVGVFDAQSEELAALYPDLAFSLKSQADIFDEYSGGTADPWAIRYYLEDQYNLHSETLKFCVLMGSGTKEWDLTTEKNKIMAFETSYGWSSDDQFCLFNSFPVLAMGRLPAQNEADMDFLLNRISTYLQESNPGFWQNMVMIIPDDENKSGSYEGYEPTSGLNHSSQAQLTAELLNPEIYVDKVMAVEYEFDEFQNKPGARIAMVNSINEGRLIWYYIGHGNEDVLGDEDYFRGSQHMNLLDNLEHLPLFLAASCEVGQFDHVEFDCLAEKLLLYEDGGSIASIAASSKCGGSSNTTLMKSFLQNILNEYPRMSIGEGLLAAKLAHTSSYSGNNRQYNVLGVPMMIISVPHNDGNITGVPDLIQPRQLVQLEGDFGSGNNFSGTTQLRVFEPEKVFTYTNINFIPVGDTIPWTLNYTKEGNKIYFSENEIENGQFSSEFYVPDDVQQGETGVIYNYYFNELENSSSASALVNINYSNIPLNVTSTSAPTVNLYLDSKTFADGDYVSTDPLLIAEIADENGINITGSAGHKMLVLLDDSFEPIDVTEGFVYNAGSAVAGELQWQLNGLEEGEHTLTLIVFDNFNNATSTETNFKAKKSGKVAIKQMLPYPNPMQSDGYFTFVITEEADVTIAIYTITGKKIKTIKAPGLSSGYNQIYWNGKDGDGDEIANNTYFYKIKAKQLSNKKVTEKIGKLIILR